MSTALRAGVIYFGIVFCAGFLLGTLRVTLLTPRLGETASVLLEAPIMLAISWKASRWTVAKSSVLDGVAARLTMGAAALGLLLAAETALSLLVFGRSLEDHFAAYGSPPGVIGLAAQIAFGLFPLLQARLMRLSPF